MIGDLKPYPKMKDSGIAWLANVPEHWKVVPVAAIAQQKSVINQQDRELLSVYLNLGVIRFSDINEKRTNVTSDDLSKYQAVDPGDFVLNNQQAWRGSVGVSKYKGIVSPAYLVLSLASNINPEYANLLFRDKSMVGQYVVCSKGVGSIQRNLYWPHLKRVLTLLPPPIEQAAIVRFLNYIDRRVNRYIRSRQKLIKLLEEQKQAIVHHAVTRGLNSDFHLKPSGVEWLGDVPEHWEIRRIRQCIESSVAGFWGDDPDDADTQNNIICVRVADFNMQSLDVSTSKLTTRSIAPGAQKTRLLQPGDLLIEKSGGGEAEPVGRAVRFSLDCRAVCSNFINRLRPDISIVRSDFLLYVLYVLQVTRRNIPSIKQTTGIQNLDERHYFRNFIGLPPLQEQGKIIEYLTRELDEIHTALDSAKHQVDLIREYRTRLIADVVTGKVDVRNVAAKLPDEIDELELVDENDTLIESENGVVDDLEETLEEAAI